MSIVEHEFSSLLPRDDTHPYRTGAWRPQTKEWTTTSPRVIGTVPDDIRGVYLRNTENPLVPAADRYHPFDGDGMLHSIAFDNGEVQYRNRFVRTKGLAAELEHGGPLWSGLAESPKKALRQDGWYLRQDIIWNKPSVMPESVTDRCTKSHEYIFLFSKSKTYYFDNESIKEPATSTDTSSRNRDVTKLNNTPGKTRMSGLTTNHYETRNKRSVWTVPTKPFKGAHFATYPPALIEPCILAGSPEEGIILDPFFGAGTTGLVALENNRQYIGCEINPEYIEIAKERLKPVVKSIENEKISTSIVNEYFKF